MKKILNLCVIAFSLMLFKPCYSSIFDSNNTPRHDVVSIFQMMGLSQDQEPTLENLNAYAQSHFLRPPKSERLSPEAIAFYKTLLGLKSDEEKSEILKLFNRIGDIEAIYPSEEPIDYILIMGSTVSSMRTRLMFLAQLFETGKIKAKSNVPIVFLTGDRDLFESETAEVLLNPSPFPLNPEWRAPKTLPTNENQLGELIWNQLALPQSLRSHNPIFIKAPKRQDQKRASTDDTVRAWLDEYSVSPGHCLIISENPFVNYQELVTRVVFQRVKPNIEGFTFQAVGPSNREADKDIDTNLGVLLDNLARTLYMQLELKKLNADEAK